METITLGRPMGRRRMAGVASAVPPEPPAEISPPMSRREPMKRSKASAMAATDAPRSPLKTAVAPLGWNRATSAGPISAGEGFWLVLRSTVTVPSPSFSRQLRMKVSSRPLVSKVPAI